MVTMETECNAQILYQRRMLHRAAWHMGTVLQGGHNQCLALNPWQLDTIVTCVIAFEAIPCPVHSITPVLLLLPSPAAILTDCQVSVYPSPSPYFQLSVPEGLEL